MADILDGKGVILKTSREFCIVSVEIDDSSKSFLFNKGIFYTFGLQCEGSLTNILEEGMEVQLCYKISGSKPFIIAVWLGDKPENLLEGKATLDPVYDKKVRVVESLDNDNFLVKDEDNLLSVIINKDVIFRNGSPEVNGALVVDEEITCDAIPLKYEDPSGALYKATCAWIGPKPRLIDRFDLPSFEDDSGMLDEKFVQGIVAVIPNSVVALVDVAFESMLIKVMLFRGSLNQSCDRIQDVIDVGDSLCMRLGWGYVFGGRKWWYALRAFKTSDVVDLESCDEISPNLSVDKEETDGKITPDDKIAKKSRVQFSKDSEVLYSVPPLSGTISRLSSEDYACITYKDLKILVHRDNMFISEKPCSVEFFMLIVAPGNTVVYFEAVLAKFSDPEKCHFTHEATLVWVEERKKPSVCALAMSLPESNLSVLKAESQLFYGIVCKYRFPNIAYVLLLGTPSTVVIHVLDFVTPPQYPSNGVPDRFMITNYVKVGDHVQFKLTKRPEHPNLLHAYEIRPVLLTKESLEKVSASVYVCSKLCAKPVPVEKQPQKDTPKASPSKGSVNTRVESVLPNPQPVPPTSSAPKVGVFTKKYLSYHRGFLLNCCGILKVRANESTVAVSVDHIFGASLIAGRACFLTKDVCVPLNSTEMLEFSNRNVRFDAEFVMSPLRNRGFRVVTVWDNAGSRPDPDRLLLSELSRRKDESLVYFAGKIKEIPLHDSAIAIVRNVPVLVTLKSLVALQEINLQTSSMETFVSPGDEIFVTIKKHELEGMTYFKSTLSYSCKNLNLPAEDSVHIEFPASRCSWSDVWGMGEISRSAFILYENEEYVVKFKSSKIQDLELTLKLFEKGNVFVDGQLVGPAMLKDRVGEPISFHVAYRMYVNGMFVACAWIGVEPPAKVVLKNLLEVPENSVHAPWRYEAVVTSFPLPSHAICHIGIAPVLLRLACLDSNHEKYDLCRGLKIGDRLIVTAHEDVVEDISVILSNDLHNLAKANDLKVNDVYRNLTGTIVDLPEPTGKIKVTDADFEVFFELCHVQRYTKKAGKTNKKWFAGLRNKLTIGKQVYFSAMKTTSKSAPYRAFEVYFVD